MEKEDFEKKLSPKMDVGTAFVKEVKIQYAQSKKKKTGQYSIQLPIQAIELLDLKKGDLVEIRIPFKDKNKYTIKFKKLIK